MSSRMEISASRYRSLPRGFLPAYTNELNKQEQQVQQVPQSQPNPQLNPQQSNSQPPKESKGLKIKKKGASQPSQPALQQVPVPAQVPVQAPVPPQSTQHLLGRKVLTVQMNNKIKLSDTL